MPDTSVPAFNELMWPTLQALKAIGGSGTIQEIDVQATDYAGLSDDQLAVLHGEGPQTEVAYRLAWARTYLKTVGALENSTRGVWAITEQGRKLTEEDMTQIPARVRAQAGGRRRRRARVEPQPPPEESFAEDSADWKEQLLQVLLALSPDQFERLSQRLLREAGFIDVEVTGSSGDGGIDGVGLIRLGSLLSSPVFFQCKRYRGSVGPSYVRDFRGAMVGRGDKGLLMTTGTFTREAENEARRPGAPPIDLIDGDRFCDLLRDLELGVRSEQVVRVLVNDSWFSEL